MIRLKGQFTIKHIRDGKLLGTYKVPNGITNEGKDKLLNIMFHGATPIATWYIGLIDAASYSALSAGDTMASHAGWIELEDYDEAARQAWSEDEASGKLITYTALSTFTISDTKTIKGLFITSDSTKGGTSGTLWSAGIFTTTIEVVDNDTFECSYEVEVQ